MLYLAAEIPQNGSFWDWVSFLVEKYGAVILKGSVWTLTLAVGGTIVGCILGFLCGFIQTTEILPQENMIKKILLTLGKIIVAVYIEVFRGTPMMVQAMVMYYGLPLVGITIDALPCGFLVVSINTGAYMAESVRGGIASVDTGQCEAGKAIGLKHFGIMRYIVLPQALRNIMPQIGNQLVINIKDTSVLNVISVSELFFIGKSVASSYYKYFESFFIVAVIYLFMTIVISRLIRYVEKRMDGVKNYQLEDTSS